MIAPSGSVEILRRPLVLPCGAVLKHRLAKSAMSDSLGDGRGAPNPRLAETWLIEGGRDPDFPRFDTMRLAALAEDREDAFAMDLTSAIRAYDDRDVLRCEAWEQKYG